MANIFVPRADRQGHATNQFLSFFLLFPAGHEDGPRSTREEAVYRILGMGRKGDGGVGNALERLRPPGGARCPFWRCTCCVTPGRFFWPGVVSGPYGPRAGGDPVVVSHAGDTSPTAAGAVRCCDGVASQAVN